jgi:hypothetical protein
MWTYRQKDGEFLHDGYFIGTGYSGTGEGRNNPDYESVRNIGPIPRGQYTIGACHDEIPGLGPCVFALIPTPSTNEFGRTDFYIHGDNMRHDASHGCIILGPTIRRQIEGSGDRDLTVI